MGKEREERVRQELRVTELEEEVERQTSHIKSAKCVFPLCPFVLYTCCFC